MTESFDPYVAWLGITDPQRPPNHYRLLGLDELEPDAQLIARSADARMANLRRVQPGSRAQQWQQLLDEMGLAKLCLTNPARKTQYDRLLEQQLQAQAAAAVAPAISGDFLPPTGQTSHKPTSNPKAASAPATKAAGPAKTIASNPSKPIATNTAPRQTTQPSGAKETAAQPVAAKPKPVPVSTGANRPIAAAASQSSGIFEQDVDTLLAEQTKRPSRLDKKADPSLRPIIIGSAVIVLAVLAAIGWAGRNRLPELGTSSTSASGRTTSPAQDSTQSPSLPPQDSGSDEQPAKSAAGNRTDQRAPTKTPEPGSQSPSEQSGNSQGSTRLAQSGSNEKNGGASPPPEQSPEDARALKKALADTQTALSERKFSQARQQLTKAAGLAKTTEQQADVVRWKLMTDYVDGFWKAVAKGMAGLRPTDDFEVGSKTVAVVEVDSKTLTLHIEGKNRSFTPADMPASLAITLAERWFDPNLPANKLYLGAFHLVDPKGDLAAARLLWQQATRLGASAEDLMPLLDRAPKRASSTGSPPVAESQLAAAPADKEVVPARRAVRSRFQREFASARSGDQKITLANTLTEAAAEAKDPLEQYALLREACDLSASRGELNEIEVGVSALSRRFRVDALAIKIEMLKKTADTANRDLASSVASCALQVGEQVVDGDRADLAKRLSPIVVATAKKSGDEALIEQAQQLKARLDRLKPGSKKPKA